MSLSEVPVGNESFSYRKVVNNFDQRGDYSRFFAEMATMIFLLYSCTIVLLIEI